MVLTMGSTLPHYRFGGKTGLSLRFLTLLTMQPRELKQSDGDGIVLVKVRSWWRCPSVCNFRPANSFMGGIKGMATKFSEIRSKITSRPRAASEREYRRLADAMPLQKLRHARNFTQQGLAKVLKVTQSEVSKIENRADVYVSTLSNYVEAMGGQLEIRAIFPEGKVRINQFDELPVRIPVPDSSNRPLTE